MLIPTASNGSAVVQATQFLRQLLRLVEMLETRHEDASSETRPAVR